MVDHFRHKGSERRGGGGGILAVIGGAMLGLDRLIRPSIEHTIESEERVLKREDDTGGE